MNKLQQLYAKWQRADTIAYKRKQRVEEIVEPVLRAFNQFMDFVDLRMAEDGTTVTIESSYPDGESDWISVPMSVFEAANPIEAAKQWKQEQEAAKSEKQREVRINELRRQLANLEAGKALWG